MKKKIFAKYSLRLYTNEEIYINKLDICLYMFIYNCKA